MARAGSRTGDQEARALLIYAGFGLGAGKRAEVIEFGRYFDLASLTCRLLRRISRCSLNCKTIH